MASDFRVYRRKRTQGLLRPYVPGEDLTGVSISQADAGNGSPKAGDFIQQSPKDPTDRWLVSAGYFEANFEPEPLPEPEAAEVEGAPV